MITCLSRFLTVLVAMVLCLSTWSGYVLGHSNVGSVRYNSKHLKGARGDMVIHTDLPGQNEELTLIEETEVLLQEDDDQHKPVHFQAIPVDYFRTVIGQTASYHEVLRIFLGEPYTDSEIDHLMVRQGHHHQGDRTSTGISGQDWLQWEATQSEYLQKAQCSTPVPEVIRVRDLTLEAGVEYMPHCVLVYRCKNDTGCCSSGYQCASKSSVNVTKYILVGVPSSQGGSGMIEMDRIQQISLQNDTECHCIKIPLISIKPCPYPFNYSLHACKCVSPAHEQHCKKISKGVNRLHTPDRICVQHGDCRPLDTSVCPYGYNIELGKCESFDGTADDRTPHRSSRT